MRRLLGVFLLMTSLSAAEERSSMEWYRLNDRGVAIDGYSPVAYFESGTPARGNPDYAATHRGVTYWLQDAAEKERFLADPERFEPAHGGWCSLMLSGSGRLTPANPETFKIVDGRLLLFWSGEFNGKHIDGRKNWDAKASGDDLSMLRAADRQWEEVLSGDRNSPHIVTFTEFDRERLSEAHRQIAKER